MPFPCAGFTLIELLVVIAIIGVLSSIILASLTEATARARDGRRASDMHSVVQALALYALDHDGNYPSSAVFPAPPNTCNGYASCISNLTNTLTPKYMTKLPADPSGAAYNYRYCDAPSNLKEYILLRYKETGSSPGWCRPQTGSDITGAGPCNWGTLPAC